MKYIFIQLLILPLVAFGQVGIGTGNPVRTVEVSGDLRIQKLEDKTNESTYNRILSADKNTGNVDYISFPSLIQSETNNVEIAKTIYISDNGISEKVCSCGEISFRLNESNVPQFKINSASIFNINDAENISIKYGAKKYNNTSFSYKNLGYVNFTKTNYMNFQNLDFTVSNNITIVNRLGNNTINIYTIVLPKENNMYRLTISKLKNTDTKNINSLICEKFYIHEIN